MHGTQVINQSHTYSRIKDTFNNCTMFELYFLKFLFVFDQSEEALSNILNFHNH